MWRLGLGAALCATSHRRAGQQAKIWTIRAVLQRSEVHGPFDLFIVVLGLGVNVAGVSADATLRPRRIHSADGEQAKTKRLRSAALSKVLRILEGSVRKRRCLAASQRTTSTSQGGSARNWRVRLPSSAL